MDGLGGVTSVSEDGATIASSMSYHPNGALAGMTYGNGQVFSQTQTVRQMPLRLRSVKASEVPLDLTYAYTARGQISSIDDQSPANIDQTFTYDGTGRLTASAGPWGAGTFSYDAIGNLVQRQVGSRVVGLSYNATSNRLSSHTDTAGLPRSLSYDARGNVTALGGLGFTYDASNQPVAAYGAVTGTYVYDGHKRRVKQVVGGETRYSVYDVSGGLVGVDQVGAGPTEYIRASGMTLARVAGASVTWLHPDHLGSAVAGTGTTGAVVWRESEQPFGEDWVSAAANDNQAGYTGHIEDAATGLVYMQARYYDPVIGRFLANDPVRFTPDRPDMFNRYAYAANDPVNATDPTGTCAIDGMGTGGFCITTTDLSFQEHSAAIASGELKGTITGASGAASLAIPGPEDLVLAGAAATTAGKAALRFADDIAGAVGRALGKEADKFADRRQPHSLQDEMTLEAASEGQGEVIIESLDDEMFKGMQKVEMKTKSSEGKDSVVHYVRDPETESRLDFKFTKRSDE